MTPQEALDALKRYTARTKNVDLTKKPLLFVDTMATMKPKNKKRTSL